MNEFDQFVKHKLGVKYYIRYADDFVILSENKKTLSSLTGAISAFLITRLKLSLHPNKVFIKTINSGVDFLGRVHFSDHRVLRTTTKRRMFKNIEADPRLEVIDSCMGLLRYGNASKLHNKIVGFYKGQMPNL
jgi:hypothetical protein